MRSLFSFLLPRYVAGTLPAFLARRVSAAIDVDTELAAAYDALRSAERAASQRPLSIGQKDAIEARLFGDDAHNAPSRARFGSLFPVVAATAAAVCFVVVRTPTPSYSVGDLAARGARIAADPVG